jgi:hypothetical protein
MLIRFIKRVTKPLIISSISSFSLSDDRMFLSEAERERNCRLIYTAIKKSDASFNAASKIKNCMVRQEIV